MAPDPRSPAPSGAPGLLASVSMLGWALNEEENVAAYIERAEAFLHSIARDFEVILIDDGSTDRTVEIVRALQQTRPWLRLYQNGQNRGFGHNIKRSVGLATKDYLFWQTVDWSYDISELGRSLHLLDEYDVLQGIRPDTLRLAEMITKRSDTPVKGIISAMNYWLIRLLFGLPLRDFQNVTVYPRRLIQSVQLETDSAFTNPECLLKVWWRGATIREVPVPFTKRRRGIAKGTRPKQLFAAIKDILYWWLRWIVLGQRRDRGRGRVIRREASGRVGGGSRLRGAHVRDVDSPV